MNNRNKKIKLAAIAGTILVGSIFAMNSEKASANVFTRGLRSIRTSFSRAFGLRSGSTGKMGPSVTPKHHEVASVKASDGSGVKLTRAVKNDPNKPDRQVFFKSLNLTWQEALDVIENSD